MAKRSQFLTWGKPRKSLGTLIPNRMIVKMPYFQAATLVASGVAYVDRTFELTSIHDPDVTGTGHRPRMVAQYNALYSYYRVRSVAVRIEMNNLSTDATTGSSQVVGTCVSDFSTAATNLEDIIESPQTSGYIKNKWKMVNHNATSYAPNRYVRKSTFDIDSLRAAIYPAGGQAPNIAALYTAVGNNPASYNVYFNVYSGNWANATDSNTDFDYNIKLTYEVEYADPIIQAAS